MKAEKHSLYSLADWKNGLAFKQINFSTTGKPVIKIAELKNGFTSQTAFTEQEFDQSVHLTKGDVVFSWSGNPETSIDAFVYDLPDGWLNQHIFKITPKPHVDKDYFFYLLKYLKPKFSAIATNKQTTGLGHVTVKDLKEIIIDLPDLDTQQAVGAYLRSIDDKAHVNQQINDNLEQQAQTIFEYLWTNSVVDEPLGKFINIKHGYAFKGEYITAIDNGIVLVTPGNFCIGGGFKEKKCKFFHGAVPPEYILSPGDLIVTMTDLSKEADTLGYGAYIPNDTSRIYLHNQRIGLVERIDNSLPTAYLYRYLRSYRYHQSIVGSASGSTVKHTAPKRITEQRITLPSQELLDEYMPILHSIDSSIDSNCAENSRLAMLRDSLLSKLISGELDLSAITL